MAMHIANSSGGWTTVRGISSFNGSTWVNGANAAIWDGTSWVGFLDKVNVRTGTLSSVATGVAALARFALSTDGVSADDVGEYNWCQNANNTVLYEATALWAWISQNGAAEPVGTFNTSLPLGISEERWQISRNTIGTSSGKLTLKVRNTLTQQELANSEITLIVTVN